MSMVLECACWTFFFGQQLGEDITRERVNICGGKSNPLLTKFAYRPEKVVLCVMLSCNVLLAVSHPKTCDFKHLQEKPSFSTLSTIILK